MINLIPENIDPKDVLIHVKRIEKEYVKKEPSLTKKVITPEDLKGRTVRFSPFSKYSRRLFRQIYTDSKTVRKNEDFYISDQYNYDAELPHVLYRITNIANAIVRGRASGWRNFHLQKQIKKANNILTTNNTNYIYDNQLIVTKSSKEIMSDEDYKGLIKFFTSTDPDILKIAFTKVRDYNYEVNKDKFLLLFVRCRNLYDLDRPTKQLVKRIQEEYRNFK